MAGLSLQHIWKKYPNGYEAVKDFNLEIADKEFIIFVGPSGCGKSTTLRMIAGLEDISSGTLSIGGRVVNDVESKDRDIAMVFQNYAIFPNLTVRKNVAFGLQNRKLPKEKIESQTEKFLKMMKIDQYADRRPDKLSGGFHFPEIAPYGFFAAVQHLAPPRHQNISGLPQLLIDQVLPFDF